MKTKPMPKRTLAALRKSIEHWTRLSTGRRNLNERIGVGDCALCKLFHRIQCIGCPVRASTRESSCAGSPYIAVVDAYYKAREAASASRFGSIYSRSSNSVSLKSLSERAYDSDTFKEAATKELIFLKSLLPEALQERPLEPNLPLLF